MAQPDALKEAFALVRKHLQDPCAEEQVQDLLFAIRSMGLRLYDNVVVCGMCAAVVESKSGHDYKTCGCPNGTMVDGGPGPLKYGRYGGHDLEIVHRFKRRAVAERFARDLLAARASPPK